MLAKVAEGVYVIDTGGLGFERTVACYLVVGDKVALVDNGYARGFERVLSALKEAGVSKLDYIIPTHVHLDHFGATGKLANHFPEARVIAHKRAVKHVINPSKVLESAATVFGENVVKSFGETIPVEEARVEAADDGSELNLGGVSLLFIYTPGHAPHQMSVMVEDQHILVTADAVFMNFPSFPALIPTTPPPSFNPEEAEKSLKKLGEMQPTLLLTPHFGPKEAGETYIQHNIDRMWRWVREVERLSKEGRRMDEIVDQLVGLLCSEAGVENAPPYVISSVRTSVMGLLHLLGRL